MSKYLFLALALTLATTFFTRNRLQTVDRIRPETLAEPVQVALAKPAVMTLTRNGYNYELTALYDYTISGLVAHKLNYGWFVIDRSEKAFPVDLCLIWGDNLRQKLHQDRSVRFSQDCRFCFARWDGNVPFNAEQLSNNHLLAADDALETKLKQIRAGDQVTLHGKLVNVKATLVGRGGRYDSTAMTWNTSTTRTDSGPGACEVIYVEQAVVLQSANLLSRKLFWGSAAGLGGLLLWKIGRLFRP